jgi:hypothetical protein
VNKWAPERLRLRGCRLSSKLILLRARSAIASGRSSRPTWHSRFIIEMFHDPFVSLSGLYTSIDGDFELCEALRARMAGALTGYISESFFVRGPCKQPALNHRIDHWYRKPCYGAKKAPVKQRLRHHRRKSKEDSANMYPVPG